MPSLLLERYQIFDKLSSRDLKTTFLAEDLQVGNHVVIKCLKPTHDNNIASDLRVELFRKEVDVIKKNRHYNTYFYPDGSIQKEKRSYNVRKIDGRYKISSSKFIQVTILRTSDYKPSARMQN